DLVYVEQQCKQTHHCQNCGSRDGNMRNVVSALLRITASQNKQTVEHCACEEAQYRLYLPISEKIVDESGAKLGGRQRQHDHGNGHPAFTKWPRHLGPRLAWPYRPRFSLLSPPTTAASIGWKASSRLPAAVTTSQIGRASCRASV